MEIPPSVTSIGIAAFSGCDSLTIYGKQGSRAESFARENGIPFSTGKIPENPEPSESPEPLPGDLDGDVFVSLVDAQLALRGLLGIVDLTEEQQKAADVAGNSNGLNLNDVQAIVKCASGLIGDFSGMQGSEASIPYPQAAAKAELRDGKLYYTISVENADISRMYYAVVYDNTCLEVETAECLDGMTSTVSVCQDIKTESHVALGSVHYEDMPETTGDIAQICFRIKGDLKEAKSVLLVMNAQEYGGDFSNVRGKEGTFETDLSQLLKEPAESAKPAESARPDESTKPAESTKPDESTKPAESAKPISKEIPVEKGEDGTIQVQGSQYFIKAAEKALEIAQNICLKETDMTPENSAQQYGEAKEILKEYNPSHMQICDMRFIDGNGEELGLQGKVSISFTIPEGFNPERVVVARIHEGMKTAEVTEKYTLYETVISEDQKTATIETDEMGTFVIMEIDKMEAMTGDLDGDSKITLKDAQMTLKAALNLLQLDEKQKQAADVNRTVK